jgi:hypothetical protein
MKLKFRNPTRNVKPKNGLAAKVTLFMLHGNGIVKIGPTLRTGVSQTASPKWGYRAVNIALTVRVSWLLGDRSTDAEVFGFFTKYNRYERAYLPCGV